MTKAAQTGAAEMVLATLGEGKSFGEIGLIDGLPRSANVIAMEPTEAYFLSRAAFFASLDEHPELARGLLPSLAAMVRNADQAVSKLLCI